jgi:cysteine dioxygenase
MSVDQHEVAPRNADARTIALKDFVAEIERISRGLITKDAIASLLYSVEIERSDLEPYKHWSEAKHTRNKIFRNDLIEVMLICWPVGAKTPLHTHNGQLGWMEMLEGKLLVENNRVVDCNRPEGQQVVGIDCVAGATSIQMEKLNEELVQPGGLLNTVDKTHTIHRIQNLAEWNERAVSLHIYSLPIDSCVVFDMEAQRCYRRNLSYDY